MQNSFSEQIQNKYTQQERHSQKNNANKFIMVPEKPMKRCTGFTYCGAKLFNSLPNDIQKNPRHQHFQNTNKGLDMEGNPILLDKF